jgi:hypothetical protein
MDSGWVNPAASSFSLASQEKFPVFADRMPNQLLAYVRLARIGDPALFAKVREERRREKSLSWDLPQPLSCATLSAPWCSHLLP